MNNSYFWARLIDNVNGLSQLSSGTNRMNLIKVCFTVLILFSGYPLPADYPVISHRYAADPSGLEYNGRIYIYCSNDDDNDVSQGGWEMHSITCFSTNGVCRRS